MTIKDLLKFKISEDIVTEDWLSYDFVYEKFVYRLYKSVSKDTIINYGFYESRLFVDGMSKSISSKPFLERNL